MKTQRIFPRKKGFTLLELMVAMAITTLIVTILVSITSVALDTWNRSRSETRAARQAKILVDTLSRDLESLVSRKTGNFEWLSAKVADKVGPAANQSANASELVFYTSATDRYDGQLGVASQDLGGNVSCVSYRLDYKDPIKTGTKENLYTFALYRKLVNPDQTYNKIFGATDLEQTFTASYPADSVTELKNYVCENIYQFSVTFCVTVSTSTGEKKIIPITINEDVQSSKASEFHIKGTGITTDFAGASGVTPQELQAGNVSSIEVSVTVLSDSGLEQLRRRKFNDTQKAEFLAKNSFQFSKKIQLTGQ